MKFKLVPMLIGVIAVATITTTPLAAFAQAQAQPKPAQPAPSQQTQPSSRPRITLTEEQQAKFEQVQKDVIKKIEEKLNPDQKKQYADARASGAGVIQSLGAIKDVSEPQKTAIVDILNKFNTQIGEILTPEQKKLIQQSQPNQ